MAIWVIAQLHLMFAAFVLAVPMVALIIQFIGYYTKDKRYDDLAHEFTKLLSTSFVFTAALGAMLTFLFIIAFFVIGGLVMAFIGRIPIVGEIGTVLFTIPYIFAALLLFFICLSFGVALFFVPAILATSDEDALGGFFTWVGNVENGDWPPQDSRKRLSRGEERMVAGAGVSPGAAVFQARGCMNCHALHGTGGTFGPALDMIGRKLSREEIEHYIENPKVENPKAMMPAQKDLSATEREAVAAFLVGLK